MKLKLVLIFFAISISEFSVLASGSDYAKPWDVDDSSGSGSGGIIFIIVFIVIVIYGAISSKNKK